MKKIFLIMGLLILAGSGCKKEYINPNAPTEDEVFNSADGMTRLIVGVKQRFAVNGIGIASIYSAISASGFSTKELAVPNSGNADAAQMLNGGSNVTPSNVIILGLWANSNLVSIEAQKLIVNSD